MALIDLPKAKAHLRLESDYPDEQVEGKLRAAELSAQQFLNRRVFEDADALAGAIAAVPVDLVAAGAAYSAAIEAAGGIEDAVASCEARNHACNVYASARQAAREIYAGLVINEQIEAGILLILGHLFENRQDVQAGVSAAELPLGATYVLMPYRAGWGV